jgi:hypothetical protein
VNVTPSSAFHLTGEKALATSLCSVLLRIENAIGKRETGNWEHAENACGFLNPQCSAGKKETEDIQGDPIPPKRRIQDPNAWMIQYVLVPGTWYCIIMMMRQMTDDR